MQIKVIFQRVFVCSLMGAFVGVLELWFYDFNLRHGVAAMTSGAVFGSLVGLFSSSIKNGSSRTIILCAVFGGVSGVVWWVLAKPTVSVLFSIGSGVVLGSLFAWGESYGGSKKRTN